VPELAILMLCVVLLTFLLGIPLLLKPDSLIPDIISFGILSVVVMAFIWSSGDYWIVLPILAVMAFVAWLDRDGQATPVGKSAAPQPAEGRRGEGAARVSDRTRLRLRLWRVANHLGLAVWSCSGPDPHSRS
jgi:hypothetical protein